MKVSKVVAVLEWLIPLVAVVIIAGDFALDYLFGADATYTSVIRTAIYRYPGLSLGLAAGIAALWSHLCWTPGGAINALRFDLMRKGYKTFVVYFTPEGVRVRGEDPRGRWLSSGLFSSEYDAWFSLYTVVDADVAARATKYTRVRCAVAPPRVSISSPDLPEPPSATYASGYVCPRCLDLTTHEDKPEREPTAKLAELIAGALHGKILTAAEREQQKRDREQIEATLRQLGATAWPVPQPETCADETEDDGECECDDCRARNEALRATLCRALELKENNDGSKD